MHARPSRKPQPADCRPGQENWSAPGAGSAWQSAAAERVSAKERLARLANTLETDVIPRLVKAHAGQVADAAPAVEPPSEREVEAFTNLVLNAGEAAVSASIDAWRARGLSMSAVYLDLLAPAARHLGVLWTEDRCDFATVTVGLGRLQRLLRESSPVFGTEIEHPPNGRRILLAQPGDEQHSFGLSMVAEFFRRAGWEVLGGVGGAVNDPSAQVAREWFDAVGFSIGSESRLDWLKGRIATVRAASRNRALVVMVGGPLFALNPTLAREVGADVSGHDGGSAPELAEGLLVARVALR
jgi:MerR family transcriptional regulator, light-induced transcriptional regulator